MIELVDYWLTFRIEPVTVDGVTSGHRRHALYRVVYGVCRNWWLGPTSFILFDSFQDIEIIATKCKTAVSASHDMIIIRKLNIQSARAVGKIDGSEMINAFMPYLTKV